MNHYRLLAEETGLPHNGLAIPTTDLRTLGGAGRIGMQRFHELKTGAVEIPWIAIAADLWDDRTVGLYDTTHADESAEIVRYRFPDTHGAWASRIHQSRQMLLLASASDFTSHATTGQALDASWLGRIRLVIRASKSGVGTKFSSGR